MDVEQIKAIIKAMDESPVSELEYTEGNVRLKIVKQAASMATENGGSGSTANVSPKESDAATAIRSENSGAVVAAPLPGIFYRSASPGEPPFVEAGARVSQGQTLGLIEAMKMLTPVKAAEDGVVSAVLVENGVSVEAGAALFEIGS